MGRMTPALLLGVSLLLLLSMERRPLVHGRRFTADEYSRRDPASQHEGAAAEDGRNPSSWDIHAYSEREKTSLGRPTSRPIESDQTTPSRFPIDSRGEILTQLQFFWHNIADGPQPTSITIANGTNTSSSPTSFGLENAFDNAITLEPELSSQVLGQSQGIYVSTGQKTASLLMVMNFFFSYGEYKGSTLAILGRNEVLNEVREMPIVGGTGHFRFSRGFVEARTHSIDGGYTIVKYNCYILTY